MDPSFARCTAHELREAIFGGRPLELGRRSISECTEPTSALVMRSVTSGEDTFIPYCYRAHVGSSTRDFLFAWLTPWDEAHRAWGNHPHEWYDDLREGLRFEVRYEPNRPECHVVTSDVARPLDGAARLFAIR